MSDRLPPRWHEALRALHERDRALAPLFEQVLTGRARRVRARRVARAAWVVAVAGAVAFAWLVLMPPAAIDPMQVSWTAWRSPTTALLGDGIAAVPAAWRSPTASVATFTSTP